MTGDHMRGPAVLRAPAPQPESTATARAPTTAAAIHPTAAGRTPGERASWDIGTVPLTARAPAAAASEMGAAVAEADTEHRDGVQTSSAGLAAASRVADVRTDVAADRTARAFGADAVAVGTRVNFRRGLYRPGSPQGDALLAHELTHVASHLRTGTLVPRRRINGDVLSRHFTDADARDLTEAELDQLIEQLRTHLTDLQDAALAENLHLLEAEVARRSTHAQDEQLMLILVMLAREYTALVTDHPERATLTEVRDVAAALDGATRSMGGDLAAQARRMRGQFASVVSRMTEYHAANDPGRSLEMWNEDTGTWLAGVALGDFERDGVLYKVRGGAAITGAFLVAMLDAGESLLSFGFHEVATAVSRAYAAGDLSVEDGNRIIGQATDRALLAALLTRGAGSIFGRLGAAGATRLGLGVRATRVLGGALAGAGSSAAATAFIAAFTRATSGYLTTGAGRRIWEAGIPDARGWAFSIGLGALFGGLGGFRPAPATGAALVGTRGSSPGGPWEVIHVADDGVVVLRRVGSPLRPPPPPPSRGGVIDAVFNPETGVWEVPSWGAPAPAPPALGAPPVVVPRLPAGPVSTPRLLPPGPMSTPRSLPPVSTRPLLPPGTVVDPVPATPRSSPIITPPPAPEIGSFVSRLSSAELARDAARDATASARTALASARQSLSLTEEWIAQEGPSPEARALRQTESATVRDLAATLRELEGSEAIAVSDAERARAAVERVAPVVDRLIGLRAAHRAGLAAHGYIRQPPNSPLGMIEHQLASLRRALEAEHRALTRWGDEVASYTPGAAGRPLALANVRRLGLPLWDGSAPIDVLTGTPLAAGWHVDHIIPRLRIAADPRFWRLTPANRSAIMLQVQENFVSLSETANTSKGASSIAAWAARLRRNGTPLRPDIEAALLEAESRATAAIEHAFQRLLAAQGGG